MSKETSQTDRNHSPPFDLELSPNSLIPQTSTPSTLSEPFAFNLTQAISASSAPAASSDYSWSESGFSSPSQRHRSTSCPSLPAHRINSASDFSELKKKFNFRRKALRDKSAKPAQPNLLDKESTNKLSKFWSKIERTVKGRINPVRELPSLHEDIFQRLPTQPDRHRLSSLWDGIRPLSAMDFSRLRPGSFVSEEKEKNKRLNDARDMYQTIVRNAEKSNTPVPPYEFLELIGKGAFGRVYKCRDKTTGNLVAIKIANIDDTDYHGPWEDHDTNIKDFKKEVSILQALKDSRAKNVNVIHEAFDLHSQLWIVADYCTGGSVRTLLRPFQGRGLDEQFVIPIARELAVALKDVHEIGIIHRDIKCSNVYITENGDIQLGDFGIVGLIDDSVSKRKTLVGTPQYMPGELVRAMATGEGVDAYGTEVDIWAYGCTLYEMATGTPPNAHVHDFGAIARKLELAAPRLEGAQYSQELRDLTALCLTADPKARPNIDAILKHPYIANSNRKYPTSILVKLIERFKVWEHGGGSRKSLWMPGGAAAPTSAPDEGAGNGFDDDDENEDGWNFSTSENFDLEFGMRYSQYLAAGDTEHLLSNEWQFSGLPRLDIQNLTPAERIKREHSELSANRGEKSLGRIWGGPDPYELHTPVEEPQPTSDLPLRTYTDQAPMRTSMLEIDLDDAMVRQSMVPTLRLNLNDVDATIKASSSQVDEDDSDDQYSFYQRDSDEKRETMAWTFPKTEAPQPKRSTMAWTFATAEPAESDLDSSMDLPTAGVDGQLAPGFRPVLKHTTTEPAGNFGGLVFDTPTSGPASASPIRQSLASNIDLDVAGLVDRSEIPRPSTASSATGSATTDMTSGNPFDLEEDEEQNVIDRDRFSYHKQWQSEGGRVKRVSHKTLPMHARGNSLSSTDSEAERATARAEGRFDGDFTIKPQTRDIGTSFDSNAAQMPWPGFEGFDTSMHEGLSARSDHRFQDFYNDGYSTAYSDAGAPNYGLLNQPEIEMPEPVAPNPNAMAESAHPSLLATEMETQMGGLCTSMDGMAQAMMRMLQDEIDENEQGSPWDADSGLDSTRETTEEEEGTVNINGSSNRRKPRKMDPRGRSPNLPQSGFQ